jgi:hypothetical protein
MMNVIERPFIREKLNLLTSDIEIDTIFLLTAAPKSQIHG